MKKNYHKQKIKSFDLPFALVGDQILLKYHELDYKFLSMDKYEETLNDYFQYVNIHQMLRRTKFSWKKVLQEL